MSQFLSELEIQFFHFIQENNVEKCKEILSTQLIDINKLYETTEEYFREQNGFVLKKVLRNQNNCIGIHSMEKNLTPLMLAAINENNLLIELFINHGAEINFQTPHSNDSALTVAISSKKLTDAISSKKIDCIQLLLEKGANPNVFYIVYTDYDESDHKEYHDSEWKTPLLYCIYHSNCIEITKLLFKFGSTIHIQYEDYMLTNSNYHYCNRTKQNHLILNKLLRLFYYYVEYLLEIIPFFIEKSIEINEMDEHGMTPLLYAMAINNLQLVKLIIENGGNIYQGTSLQEIFEECNDEIKEYITEYISHPYVLK